MTRRGKRPWGPTLIARWRRWLRLCGKVGARGGHDLFRSLRHIERGKGGGKSTAHLRRIARPPWTLSSSVFAHGSPAKTNGVREIASTRPSATAEPRKPSSRIPSFHGARLNGNHRRYVKGASIYGQPCVGMHDGQHAMPGARVGRSPRDRAAINMKCGNCIRRVCHEATPALRACPSNSTIAPDARCDSLERRVKAVSSARETVSALVRSAAATSPKGQAPPGRQGCRQPVEICQNQEAVWRSRSVGHPFGAEAPG